MASSFITSPTLVKNLDNCAYQINFTTASAMGTFAVQASVDYEIDEPTNTVVNPGNWANLPLGGSPVASGSSDTILINLNQLPFNAIRVTYTASSGTGSADIFVECRQIGG